MSAGVARWRIRCQRPIAYDIVEAPRLFDPRNLALLSDGRIEDGRRFVVIDRNVARHHAGPLRTYFDQHGIEARIVLFPGGEASKSIELYLRVLRELDAFPLHRRDEPIIAIGGGVLTDVVGFAASSYRRGLPHIKVPTTLMGYVDASVGVKTGINFNGRKNRLGSFEPPLRVLLDRAFLETLPRRHVMNGVCEIIKLAIIKDLALFTLLEEHGVESIAARFQNPAGAEILERAISGMVAELERNLFEDDLARRVDFGHTFSQGLETRHGARLLHGEAVLLDIAVSTLIARRRGLLSQRETDRIFSLFDRLGMALDLAVLETELMWQSLLERIEHRNGLQRTPVPAALGDCVFLNDLARHEIDSAIGALEERIGVRRAPGAAGQSGESCESSESNDRILEH
jgi:3-dehydroquinate synthetase